MASDSQITYNGSKIINVEKENLKIWHPDEKENVVIGASGSVREINVIKSLGNILDEVDYLGDEINLSSLTNKTVKAMFKELKEHGVIKDENPVKMNNRYLIAYNSKLYLITTDGAVVRMSDYAVIGSGSYEAIGVLSNNRTNNPKEDLLQAIRVSIKNDIHCDFPIVLTNTKSKEIEILKE
jgi:20S proteasome alpha/beta subunit